MSLGRYFIGSRSWIQGFKAIFRKGIRDDRKGEIKCSPPSQSEDNLPTVDSKPPASISKPLANAKKK
nr:expressed protein [Hymenolepis microstoma]